MENQIKQQLIYSRMIKSMKEVGVIGKDQTNSQQGFKYRGIDDVMNGIHDIFAENSIFIVPTMMETTRTERVNAKGTTLFYVTTKMNYRFVTDDGSYVECIVTGEGMDSGDKATTKAMSIALKYALTQMLLIPTSELKDPDGESHEVKPDSKARQDLKEKSRNAAMSEMTNCKTLDEVKNCWSKWKFFQTDAEFIQLKDEMKTSLNTIPA